ncbi:MAG: hypothetical protein A3B68_04225 [Candidatus Melainabacteria bacterium RIFCSPHIGHO2_02_FULL_34_12]|nr:MAG: hypothetical protein A3B68_04225 [Candidatus Melainabacteria bacterium RIFCSPHIGHO2_02_FULL_34_12]
MEDLRQIIKNIRLIVLDVDGVLTDGSLFYSKDGEHIKRFNVRDGQGIKLAQAYKIEIAIISARECEIVKNRFNELGVKHIYQHCYDKAKKIKEIVSELNISLNEAAYIGDDILDVPVLEIVGLPVCPNDAHPSAQLKSKIITQTKGGIGCVRELIDLILEEQGKITL